jgi:hypothetical protein
MGMALRSWAIGSVGPREADQAAAQKSNPTSDKDALQRTHFDLLHKGGFCGFGEVSELIFQAFDITRKRGDVDGLTNFEVVSHVKSSPALGIVRFAAWPHFSQPTSRR